jgi:hypothetical protein
MVHKIGENKSNRANCPYDVITSQTQKFVLEKVIGHNSSIEITPSKCVLIKQSLYFISKCIDKLNLFLLPIQNILISYHPSLIFIDQFKWIANLQQTSHTIHMSQLIYFLFIIIQIFHIVPLYNLSISHFDLFFVEIIPSLIYPLLAHVTKICPVISWVQIKEQERGSISIFGTWLLILFELCLNFILNFADNSPSPIEHYQPF